MNKAIKQWAKVKAEYERANEHALAAVLEAQEIVLRGCGQRILNNGGYLPIAKGISIGTSYQYGEDTPSGIYTEFWDRGGFVQRGEVFGAVWNDLSLKQAKKLVRAMKGVKASRLIKEWAATQ